MRGRRGRRESMPILLARVDNRLVHGQVLEAWVPRLGVDTLLVVDADLVDDPLQRAVLESLDRPGLQIRLETPAAAARSLEGPLRDRRVMVLFRGLGGAVDAMDGGVRFAELNLGNVHPAEGSRAVTASVYLSAEDEAAIRVLLARGVAVEARAVPADRPVDVASVLEGSPR